MSTIKDVAKRVGVSTAPVSHVVNKTRFVSERVTRKVIEAIQELNYQPNAIARSLVKRKTHTIGIIISDILNPFYTAIVRGIEDVTYKSKGIFFEHAQELIMENFHLPHRTVAGVDLDGEIA